MSDLSAETAQLYRPRVAFTPGSIQGVVTARKRHRCQTHLTDQRHYIEPGDRYVTNALPPDHSDIGNPGWWHLRVCLDCCPIEHDPRTAELKRCPRCGGYTDKPLDGNGPWSGDVCSPCNDFLTSEEARRG